MKAASGVTAIEAIEANKFVHAFLANSGAYQQSPHFNRENQVAVRGVVERLRRELPRSTRSKAIDFGCGTGFMISLMNDLFDEVHGVDITPDMMKHVDLASGNVFLHESVAEATPFAEAEFDFATAYSFMDHLLDYQPFLREAHRVLKPGGMLYSDLNPNRAFIVAMESASGAAIGALPPVVEKEVHGALHNGAHYEATFGLSAEMLERAEPIKTNDKGFDAREVIEAAMAIGFSRCNVEYSWFLGQAPVLHGPTPANVDVIDGYLRSVLPVSAALYKYLRLVFVK